MKRNRPPSRKRASIEATALSRLAICLAESGCRFEQKFWDKLLTEQIQKTLQDGAEDDFNAALDRLMDANTPAYDYLAEAIESAAESSLAFEGEEAYDILLFNASILAWSRFSIASGSIPKNILEQLKEQLSTHIFSINSRIALADFLFSPDQLPRSFIETWELTQALGSAALKEEMLNLDPNTLAKTNPFLSDTRYLIGAIAIPRGEALFRWNETPKVTRDSASREWLKQGSLCLEPLLTGCAFQLLLPDAYHAACRSTDIASRPYSLRASVDFLQTTLGEAADRLRVTIGAFYDKRLEEYRIGFGSRENEAIFHGVTWPLLGAEDENTDILTEIESVLRDCGIKEIITHNQQFPFEFCDDCGAPLYPNLDGEPVHAEMPESNNEHSQTLH